MSSISLFPEPAAPEVPFRENEPGTWLEPSLPLSAHLSALFKAKQAFGSIRYFQTAYSAGIEAFEQELKRYEHGDEPFEVNLRHLALDHTAETEIECIILEGLSGNLDSPDAEFKRRTGIDSKMLGIHIPQVGSLVLTRTPKCNLVHYSLHRSNFFRDSYLDHQPIFEAPYTLWDGVCCARTIAESGCKVASCKSFTFGGVEYINDGQMSSHVLCSCEGWTFRPVEQWEGPTYTYEQQVAAWDDGRLDRGDRRGLVVRVNRHTVVLDGSAAFFDRRKAKQHSQASTPKKTHRAASKEPAQEAERMVELF